MLKIKICFIVFILLFQVGNSFAQDSSKAAYEIVLFGNTSAHKMGDKELKQIDQHLKEQKGKYTSFHLGDIGHQDGFTHKRKKKVKKRVDQLLELSHKKKGRLYFLPGDHDWNNSGKRGLETVKELENYIEKELKYKDAFLPSNGCPGPVVLDLNEEVRVIAINTQWFIHPYKKSAITNTACSNLTVDEFFEDLEGQIDEAEGRQVVLLGHHPIISFGEYGGRIPIKKHLFPFSDKNPDNRFPLPVLGSVYAAYRQNVGTPRDMAYPKYQAFILRMEHMLSEYNNLIYASAHENSLQLNEVGNNFQVISGSMNAKGNVYPDSKALFGSNKKGFSKILLMENGNVDVAFYAFTKDTLMELCHQTIFTRPKEEVVKTVVLEGVEYSSDTVVTVGGLNYKMKGLLRLFFGSLYRDAWATEVSIPLLNLDTTFGGMKAFAKGGGLQTYSLKLKTGSKKEYVFRSVNKDPSKAFERDLKNTLIMDFIQDMIATQHPFGALPVSYLLDHTSLLHARPKLYVMPEHQRLGVFNDDFKGVFGLLEDKPIDPKKNRPGWEGADDITKSISLFRKLYSDKKTKVDTKEFAIARMFDMLIGDWDRHEDNIKWAGFRGKKDKWEYRPIPRDRDHSFSKRDGFFHWIMDREWAFPHTESFGYDFKGLKSLNNKAQFLDRALLSELNQKDWEDAAEYLVRTITEDVIDSAMLQLPKELTDEPTQVIGAKLKARRLLLKQAAIDHYLHLSKGVDIVGTNERELFKVKRNTDGSVEVKVFKQKKKEKKGKKFYERTFVKNETKEIRLYGLGSDDIFEVKGHAKNSILIRIIGGYGEDKVRDESTVSGLRKYTQVYDHHKKTVKSDSGEVKFEKLENTDTYLYSRKTFKEDTYFPMAYMGYNKDDNLFISGGVTFTNHGFMEDGFLSKHKISSTITSRSSFVGQYDVVWRKRRKRKLDYGLSVDAATRYPLYDFYGLGNEVQPSRLLREQDFYKINYRGGKTKLFLQHRFFYRSSFRVGLSAEGFTTVTEPGTILDGNQNEQLRSNRAFFLGGFTEVDVDLRNKSTFPERGMRLFGNYQLLTREGQPIHLLKGSWEHYSTIHILTPITLGVKVGGEKAIGEEQLPFYKMPHLGQDNSLRGYRNNSFIGTSSLYFNSDIRLHIGKMRTIVAPMHYGLIGLFDIGKVWYNDTPSNTWHKGYGGGAYIAPVSKDYALKLLFTHSAAEKLLVQINIGLAL